MTFWLDPEILPEELRDEVVKSKLRSGYTLMHGHVVDAETCKPLAGVRIRVEKAQMETRTDDRGYYSISVPSPPPTSRDLPGTETLTAELPGYKTIICRNFPAVAGQDAGFNLDLERGSGVSEYDRTHKMMRDPGQAKESQTPEPQGPLGLLPAQTREWIGTPGKALAVGVKAGPDNGEPVSITLPQGILVGFQCTCNTCTDPNPGDYSLEEYVRIGLSVEWISGWHENSLKSGAVAYRSVGAWYVMESPLAINYDICSSECCQVFTPKPKNKVPTAITNAVNATAGVVLTRNMRIFKAEYARETNGFGTCNDGWTGAPSADPSKNWPCMNDFVCAGAAPLGHPRGMCQNGSQRWATGTDRFGNMVTTPKDWRCILDHYYNDNYNSTQAGSGLRTSYIDGRGGDDSLGFSVYNSKTQQSSLYTMNGDGSGQKQLGVAAGLPVGPPAGA